MRPFRPPTAYAVENPTTEIINRKIITESSKPYNNCVTYCGEETTVGLAKVQDLVMELEAGKLDVVFLDYMTVLSYADAKEDLAAVDLGIPETSDGYSIAVKKGNTELAEFINGVLAELKEQNTIEQFIVEAKKLESAAE